MFEAITLAKPKLPVGFAQLPRMEAIPLLDAGIPVTPDVVRRALTVLAHNSLPILIVDEFDRLPVEARRAFADTIKTLS